MKVPALILLLIFSLAAAKEYDDDSSPETSSEEPSADAIECFPSERKNTACNNNCRCSNGKWLCTNLPCAPEEKNDIQECTEGEIKLQNNERCRCDAGCWACDSTCHQFAAVPLNDLITEVHVDKI